MRTTGRRCKPRGLMAAVLCVAMAVTMIAAPVGFAAAESQYFNDFENAAGLQDAGTAGGIQIQNEEGETIDTWFRFNSRGSVSIESEDESENRFFRIATEGTEPQIYRTVSYTENTMEIRASMKVDEFVSGGYSMLSLRQNNSSKIGLVKIQSTETQTFIGLVANGNRNASSSGVFAYREVITNTYNWGDWLSFRFVIKNIDGVGGDRILVDAYMDKGDGGGEQKLVFNADGSEWSGDTNFLVSNVKDWNNLFLAGQGYTEIDFDNLSVSVENVPWTEPEPEHEINYYEDFSNLTVGSAPTSGSGFSFAQKDGLTIVEENGAHYCYLPAVGTDQQMSINLGADNPFSNQTNRLVFQTRMRFKTGSSAGHTRIRAGKNTGSFVNLILFQNNSIGVLDYDGNAKNAVSGWTYEDGVWYDIAWILDYITGDTPLLSVYIHGENGDSYRVEDLGLLAENLTASSGTVTQDWVTDAFYMSVYSNSVDDGMRLWVDSFGLSDLFSENAVANTTPEDGKTSVERGVELSVSFNNPAGITDADFTLTAEGGYPEPWDSIHMRNGGHTLVLQPAEPLVNGVQYHAEITGLLDYYTGEHFDTAFDFTVAQSNFWVRLDGITEAGQVTAAYLADNADSDSRIVKAVLAQCTGTADNYTVVNLAETTREIPGNASGSAFSVSITPEETDGFYLSFAADGETLAPLAHTAQTTAAGTVSGTAEQFNVTTAIEGDRMLVRAAGAIPDARVNEEVLLYVENEAGELIHIQQGVCGPNGAVDFLYTFDPENPGGDYRHSIRTQYGAVAEKMVYIESLGLLQSLLTTVNTAGSAAEIKSALTGSAADYCLECTLFDKIDKTFLSQKLHEAAQQERFADISALKNSIEALAALSALNQEISGVISGGLLQYTGLLGIDSELYEAYEETLNSAGQSAVNRNMTSRGFADAESAAKEFARLVYTNQITNYTKLGIGHAEEILLAHGAKLGLDLSDYAKLTAEKQETVLRALCNSGAATPEALAQVYNSAVSDANKTTASSGRGSGSSGGSSSGRTGSTGGGVSLGIKPEELQTPVQPEQSEDVFADMADYDWAAEAVTYLRQRGIVNGKAQGQFAPQENITREEFAAMVIRAFDFPEDVGTSVDFEDVVPDAWYYEPVMRGAALGLINGVAADRFGTGESITREDIAALLCRVMAALGEMPDPEQSADFMDADQISGYAVEGVSICRQLGLINGYPDGNFCPQQPASRAETAKILYSVMNYMGV